MGGVLHLVQRAGDWAQWSNCGGTRGNGVPLPFLAGNAVSLAYTGGEGRGKEKGKGEGAR